MIPFSQFELPTKKYVALNFTEQSSLLLRAWCEYNKFDLSKSYSGENIHPEDFGFHITVFYTNNEIRFKDINSEFEPVSISCSGMDLFGLEKNVPVLKIAMNEQLLVCRKFFEAAGFRDNWNEWKPHVSVSYASASIDGVEVPKFPLYVNKIIIEDQNV
jgi:hypothetical protein